MPDTMKNIELDIVGDVMVAKILESRLLHDPVIQLVRNQLMALTDVGDRKNIIIDLSLVESMSSSFLSHLLVLEKRIKSAQGQLFLCGLCPEMQNIFSMTRLDRIFQVFPDRFAALACF